MKDAPINKGPQSREDLSQAAELTQKIRSLIFSTPNLSGDRDKLMKVTNTI